MEPTNSDFQYAQIDDGSSPTNTHTNKSTNPSHDWGGTIDVDYMFPGNSRDVKLSYTHLHMDDNSGSASTVGTSNTINSPFGYTGADGARASSDNDLDAVDLVFGQWIRIGERVDLHPFGGLRYASIDMNDKATYSVSTDETNYGTGKVKSDFSGIGPRAGLDATVHVGSGVSFVGTVGASLLVGSTDSKVSNGAYVANELTDGATYKNDEGTHVIPELDARLGVNYTYNFDPATALGVELGYQAVNYFDVADKDYIDATAPNTINNSEDFGYHGPYLRVQVSMA